MSVSVFAVNCWGLALAVATQWGFPWLQPGTRGCLDSETDETLEARGPGFNDPKGAEEVYMAAECNDQTKEPGYRP